MQAFANYYLIWAIYLAAAALFYGLFWYMTRFPRARWLSCLLRTVMATLIITPWYANSEQTVLAPALMVAMLDAVTSGGSAAGRALSPLALALVVVLLGAGLLFILRSKSRSKRYSKQ